MKRGYFICKLLVLALGLSFLMESQVFASHPQSWPKPWDRSVRLRVGRDNPTSGTHVYGTWLEGSTGMKYAVDLLPLEGSTEVNNIRLYAPAAGTVVCSNELNPNGQTSCEKGHNGFGTHIIIRTETVLRKDNNDKDVFEEYLMAHLAGLSKTFSVGSSVSVGEYIGLMGDTGNGPLHLHFELINRRMTEQIGLFGIGKWDFNNHRTNETALRGDWVDGQFSETLVAKGYSDRIEDILEELDLPFILNELQYYDDFSSFNQIYINCGALVTQVDKIKNWVEAGGSLYVSDLAYNYVTPWGLTVSRTGMSNQTISASVEDKELRTYLGGKSTINIFYDASDWAVITSPYAGKVLLRAGYSQQQDVTNSPLAVLFNAGKGNVLFTTFHNSAAGLANPDVNNVIKYFAYIPKKGAEVIKLLNQYGISADNLVASAFLNLMEAQSSGINVEGAPNGTKGTFFFNVTDTLLNSGAFNSVNSAAAASTSSESCTVSLYKPDGSLYKTVVLNSSNTAVINVPAKDNNDGAWQFKVDSYTGFSGNAMVIAASTFGTEVGRTASRGGCTSSGFGFGLFLLAVFSAFKKRISDGS